MTILYKIIKDIIWILPLLFLQLPNLSAQESIMGYKVGAAPTPSPEASEQDIKNRNSVPYPVWRLRKDWIYQDYGLDTGKCFSSETSNEIETEMIRKIIAELKNRNIAVESYEKSLESLLETKTPGIDSRWQEFYFQLCDLRRLMRLSVFNQFPRQYIYAKHHVFADSQPQVTVTTHQTDDCFQERGCDYQLGSELCIMTVGENGNISTEILYECPTGILRDPCVSYDGTRVVFSMRKNDTDDDFHLYVLNLSDRKIRQITWGAGTVDMEPCYLPSGDIIFVSTRCDQSIPCWYNAVTNLYTCDGEGRYIRRLSYDQANVVFPQVLSDGRITFTRWEYLDRINLALQPAFVMNHDGTNQTEFYGNNSLLPASLIHVRGVPNSSKAVAIMTGHHCAQHGKAVIIDRSKGTQENQGLKYICPEKEIVFPSGNIFNFTSGGLDYFGYYGDQYQYPLALNEQNYLISYIPESTIKPAMYPLRGPYPNKFGIYWMGINGERELLIYDPTISSGQHSPLGVRETPPMKPTQVNLNKNDGTFYIQEVAFIDLFPKQHENRHRIFVVPVGNIAGSLLGFVEEHHTTNRRKPFSGFDRFASIRRHCRAYRIIPSGSVDNCQPERKHDCRH
jgi:hypothetical protein